MGKIIKVSGPLVVADGMADANMADVVRVGPQQLIGEILNMTGDRASIQVYEETSGLGPGADVVTTGAPLSVELGPGLIENIYDGIQRQLEEIVRRVGSNITRGIQVPPLDRDRLWNFTPTAAVGDTVAMVTVEGVECSEATVKDGSYKIQRPFVFVTNKSVALSEQAQAFVDFATSKDAADLIRTAGAVPVNE